MSAMKWISSLRMLALLAVFGGASALAADKPAIPADKFIYCTVCHGVQMGGNPVLAAPRLSGMDAWYIERQLQAFRDSWRGTHEEDAGGQEMRPMAAALTDRDISAVAEYVQSAASAPPAITVDGDAERGKSLYQSCVACHGARGEGNPLVSGPALTGLNDWYLLTQLENYKAGIRGSHPDDTTGQQMRAATALLADTQAMKDVVHYISTMQSQHDSN